jgi:light-regulated signal transduction histidine kinase (bacteriophytochrome)
MIASFAQLLADRHQGRLNASGEKYLSYIVDGAQRMQELIIDLLDYSRVESKEDDLYVIETAVPLQKSLLNLKKLIDEEQCIITVDDLPLVRGDESLLTLLFQNLISNAIKFKSDKNPEIHIRAEQSGGRAIIFIEDNGIGIDEKYADRIFNIFKRLHSRNEYPGTGLGLAVCKRIIERHNGTIGFKKNPSGGTIFFFELETGT